MLEVPRMLELFALAGICNDTYCGHDKTRSRENVLSPLRSWEGNPTRAQRCYIRHSRTSARPCAMNYNVIGQVAREVILALFSGGASADLDWQMNTPAYDYTEAYGVK